MCGIFGIYSIHFSKHIINNVIKQLNLLQHRGKDGCGIGYIEGDNPEDMHPLIIKNYGLVNECFNDKYDAITNCCIGHLKYSTSGQSIKTDSLNKNTSEELQPLSKKYKNNNIIIVHNGNIPSIKEFDTQFILDMIINSDLNIEDTLINIMNKIPASYCLLIIINDALYVMRDRYGIRPLSMGEYEDSIYISSETVALNNCKNIKEIESGTIMRIDKMGPQIIYKHPKSIIGICAFELIYFMNPNSFISNISIESIRCELGNTLAKNEQIIKSHSDYIVIGIPNSGLISAKAYANNLSLDYSQSIKKVNKCNNGEDRTFILINNNERKAACKKKFIYDIDNIKGKKIIIVDDTIVRGNVIKTIIDNCKSCGAKEIHIRIPAPPIIDKCQLGIAIHNKTELIMNNRTIDEVKNLLNIDSLAYLSVDDLTMIPKDSYKEFFGCGIPTEITNFQEE
jgi:amidophosphoribosyltransferase